MKQLLTIQRSLLLLLFLLTSGWLLAQSDIVPKDPEAGRPKAIDYPVGSFGADRESWAIDQAPNGLIYAANNAGLLEFDGVAWTTYELPNNAPVRSLDISADNKIYVGGVNAMGFFAYTPKDGLQFNNLRDKLPVEQRDFSDIWEVVVQSGDVLFFSHSAIYVYDGTDFQVIRPKANTIFSEGFVYKDQLYVYDLTNGLQMVRNNKLVRVGWASRLRQAYIYSMMPFGKDLLVGTRELGLMRYDGRSITPFETELPKYVEEKVLTNGLTLENGYLVFSTIGRGIILLTPKGKLVGQFDDEYGLQDDKVLDMLVDHQGSLWLAMNNGISMLDYPSPMTYFRDLEGLTGEVYDFIRHKGVLYAGTYKGIYYLDTTQTRAAFKRLEGVASECFAFSAAGDGLFAATGQGIYKIEGFQAARQVYNQPAKVLLVNEQRPDLMLVGNRKGLTILERRGGRWQSSARLSGISASISSMAADNDGTAWLTTESKGVLQIAHLYDNQDYSVRRLDTASGLPSLLRLTAFTMNGEVRIGSPQGLYKWDKRAQMFVADQTRSIYLGNGKWGIKDLTISPKGDLWVLPGSGDRLLYHNRLHNHRLNLQEIPISMVANSPGALLSIYADGEEAIWLGMQKGILRYKNDWRTRLIKDTTRIVFRSVYLENGEQDLPPFPTENYQFSNFAGNNIQINFAAIGFKQPGTTRYQYLLNGRGKNEWSEYSTTPHIKFTNLPDGDYTLYIRAITGEDYPTKIASLSFSIQPPWFRSWWAISLYLIFGAGLVYQFIRVRTQQLEKDRELLEDKVRERTNEVLLQKEVLEETFKEITNQNEQLQVANIEIQEKNEELNAQREELENALNELRSTQGQLIMSEKMATLGQLVAGVAHEINTPIGVINASGGQAMEAMPSIIDRLPKVIDELETQQRELLFEMIAEAMEQEFSLSTREARQMRKAIQEKLEAIGAEGASMTARELVKAGFSDDNLEHYAPLFTHTNSTEIVTLVQQIGRMRFHINNILTSVGKTQKIIFALKSYSYRHAQDDLIKTDLVANVKTVLTIYENSLKSHEVITEFEDNLPEIYAYPDELSQVWTNLITNALHAIGEKGTITVRVGHHSDTHLYVQIIDSGSGIPQEIQDRIFDAFFTTKPQGQGTGLGLDIVKKLIDKHDGEIFLESEPGRTQFTMTISKNLKVLLEGTDSTLSDASLPGDSSSDKV